MDNKNNSNYVNVPIEEMMDAAQKSIKNGEAIWFGCDVDKNVHHKNGIFDTESINYEQTLDMKLDISKGDALYTMAGQVSHAMIIKGFNKEDKEVDKWLVENSWGDENDHEGDYVMSTPWFKRHVYEIVIDKKFCSPKVIEALKLDPIEKEIWDPFGNLLL